MKNAVTEQEKYFSCIARRLVDRFRFIPDYTICLYPYRVYFESNNIRHLPCGDTVSFGTLYLGKCGKSQRISVYVLGLLIPSIVEKVALYLIGAFLCGIDPANIAGVMEAAASREPFVNLFTQPSARYVINILFFNWAYIVCGILFSALCIVFLSKARKVTAA